MAHCFLSTLRRQVVTLKRSDRFFFYRNKTVRRAHFNPHRWSVLLKRQVTLDYQDGLARKVENKSTPFSVAPEKEAEGSSEEVSCTFLLFGNGSNDGVGNSNINLNMCY